MRVGIDLDGVVADFNAGWMRLHADEFGSDLVPEMVTGWDGLHELAGFADMEAFWTWAQGTDLRPSIFRHLELFDGAATTMRALADAGHEIAIITAKPAWSVPDTLRWIADHELPVTEIHIRHDKYLVDCDVYLDDAPNVLQELSAHRPEATVCRMVRPWNRPIDGVVDVNGWRQFGEVVARC